MAPPTMNDEATLREADAIDRANYAAWLRVEICGVGHLATLPDGWRHYAERHAGDNRRAYMAYLVAELAWALS